MICQLSHSFLERTVVNSVANDIDTPPLEQLDCSYLVEELYPLIKKDACSFAEAAMRKHLPHVDGLDTAEDFVSNAFIKIWSAEKAIQSRHAVVLNRRIQLRPEAAADPKIAKMYQIGMRHWDRSKHTFKSFFHLVLVSDMRNSARKLSFQREKMDFNHQIGEERGGAKDFGGMEQSSNPERKAAIQLAKLDLIEALDAVELKKVAALILLDKYGIIDVAFELGLSRSQVEKRVLKIKDVAARIAATNRTVR